MNRISSRNVSRGQMLEPTQLTILYLLATASFLVIIWTAINMTLRVGTGPGLLPVVLDEGLCVLLAFFFALGLGCLWFLKRPNWIFLVGLALAGVVGFIKGTWRYFWYDAPYDFNPDNVIDPSSTALMISACACLFVIATALYYLRLIVR